MHEIFSAANNSLSHPPILSITTMAKGEFCLCLACNSKSNLSSTKDCQNCLRTYSLIRPVQHGATGCQSFPSKRVFFLPHAAELCMPVLQLLVHSNTHGNTHGASEGQHKVTPRGTATSRHAHITLVARRVYSARWPNKSIAEGLS